MGFFDKLLGEKKEGSIPLKGLKELCEFEFMDGEFTLPFKLWGSLHLYKYNAETDHLDLIGNPDYKVSNASKLTKELVDIFGIDSSGQGHWSKDDDESLKFVQTMSRQWLFDENLNVKPVKWCQDEYNNYDWSRAVSFDCGLILDENAEDVPGVSLTFSNWEQIRAKLSQGVQ